MVSTPFPPGPRARFPGAHLLAFSRDRLGFVCHLKRTYGDVVAFRLGPERMVLLTHPEHMHDVITVQVVNMELRSPLATAEHLQAAKTAPLHPAEQLHRRR